MCGIWGHYGYFFPSSIPTRKWQKFTIGTAIAIQLRGIHALGWYAARRGVDGKSMDTQLIRVSKSAGKYFLDEKNQPGLIRNLEPTVYLGHVRAATVGAQDVDHAHPHAIYSKTEDGKLSDTILSVLTHNGTLRSWQSLKSGKDDITKTSDSAALGWSMYKEGVRPILDDLNGAFALAYYDQSENLLTLARNNERPLHFVQTASGILWCSEPVYCDFGLQHADLTLPKDAEWRELPEFSYMQLRHDLTTGGKLEVIQTGTLSKPTYSNYSSRGNSPYRPPAITHNQARHTSRSWPRSEHNSGDSYEIPKNAVIGKDYPAYLAELYLQAYRIRMNHRTPGSQNAYTTTWERTCNWPEDRGVESAGLISASGEPIKHSHGNVHGPMSTLQCILADKNGNIVSFGDFFNNNYQEMRAKLNMSKRQAKRAGEEPVVFNISNIPTSVACGLLEDTNASMFFKLQEHLTTTGIHLYRHTNAMWSHWSTWSSIHSIHTMNPVDGEVLVCPKAVLDNPYIHVEGASDKDPGDWYPYCQEAMSHCGAMLYFEKRPGTGIHPIAPQEVPWVRLDVGSDYFLFPEDIELSTQSK